MATIATSPRRHLALRIPADELDRIDQLAKEHRLTRTDYLIRAGLGQLADPIELEARFKEIHRRLDTVERLANLAF